METVSQDRRQLDTKGSGLAGWAKNGEYKKSHAVIVRAG